MELYQYDFSEFDGADVDEHGLFGYKYLDHYWTEPNRHPFLVRVSGRLAGFVLVRIVDEESGAPYNSMAEFFTGGQFEEVRNDNGHGPIQEFWSKKE